MFFRLQRVGGDENRCRELNPSSPLSLQIELVVDMHGLLRYRDTDNLSRVAVKQKEWYHGFPVSYETESPFFNCLCLIFSSGGDLRKYHFRHKSPACKTELRARERRREGYRRCLRYHYNPSYSNTSLCLKFD